MHPHPDVLAQACVDLCEAKGWHSAALLHEGSASGAALLAPDGERLALLSRRLPPPADSALLRNLLLVLKKSGVTKFIVWCGAACCARVLDAAQRVGLLDARHSYVLLTLDLHTVPLAAFSHGGANITTLQLYDQEIEEETAAAEEWRTAYARLVGGAGAGGRGAAVGAGLPVALSLARMGAELVAEARARLRLPAAAPGDCARGTGAFHADTLLNYLRSEEWGPGATWEADGARRDVRLRVAELASGGGGALVAEAAWAPAAGLQWRRTPRPAPLSPPDSMTNRTFIVLIALNKPYVMRKESSERLSGNDRFEGFCIELIEQLSKLLHFNYTFLEQEDGVYGSLNTTTGRWNGMMGRLMEDPEIDFAITDLTITAEREQAVDFTTTFMNLGISILFRTPKPPEPELFAFLLPFSNGVWLCLGLAYVGTSLVLFVVGRLCPEEWQNPYPCVAEPQALQNQFTLANALWFNLGAVLLQGSEIAPLAYGTRAVASMWWLFALVITSSYTANLATHHLWRQAGGSTYTFFEHSQNKLYQDMFEQMKQQEMPRDNNIGITKVMKENYAFLMESTSIEYTIERNCEVTKVGGLLDSKGYGIAMKKNSPYRQEMNLALLNLQEAGILREMKHEWWNEKHGGGACKKPEERESTELSMASFLGLFLVLAVGCALGVALACADLARAAWRRPRAALPFSRRFAAELRFVFSFNRSVKPLQGPLFEKSPSTTPARSESLPAAAQDAEEEAETEADAAAEAGSGPARGRTQSLQSAHAQWARRRSSMHAASARLARHASRRSRHSRRSSSPHNAHAHPPPPPPPHAGAAHSPTQH
ncbi:hypothetical protein ACJJTC_005556 [Scirpophaga incertulas]